MEWHGVSLTNYEGSFHSFAGSPFGVLGAIAIPTDAVVPSSIATVAREVTNEEVTHLMGLIENFSKDFDNAPRLRLQIEVSDEIRESYGEDSPGELSVDVKDQYSREVSEWVQEFVAGECNLDLP